MRIKRNVCSRLWTDTNIDLQRQTIKHCCKTISSFISLDDINNHGENVFESFEKFVDDRRQMIDTDTLPAACVSCYEQGDNAIKHIWNLWSDNFITHKGKALLTEKYTNYIDIDMGPSCNLACIYCGPWSSTAWAKELGTKVNGKLNQEWKQQILAQLAKWLTSMPDDRHVTFNLLGGEPLMIVDTYDLISYLATACEHFKVKPTLMITTNMSVKPKLLNRLMKVIDETSDIFEWVISISIEDINERAEAIRYNLDWKEFNKNIDAIKLKVEKIYITTTFNLFSFPYFDEFLKWAFDKFGGDNYTKTWDFTMNAVQEGYTNVAYLHKEQVDIDHIKAVYNKLLGKFNISQSSKTEDVLNHIDNLYAILGDKCIDQQFISYWYKMSQSRNTQYIDMKPLKYLLDNEK